MASFHLNYFLNTLSLTTHTLEIRVPACEFWRDTIQSTKLILDTFGEAPVLKTGEEPVCLMSS